MSGWGKTPVRSADAPGFVVNRVNRPFTLEALRLLEDGHGSVEGIDAAVRADGFPMGPFELMDLVGIDVNLAAARGIWEAFRYEPRFRPSPIQERLVEAGRLGRKTGEGFYWYGDDGRRIGPAGAFVVDDERSSRRTPSTRPIERIVVAIANEAYRALGEGVAIAGGHRPRPASGRRPPARSVRAGRALGRRRSGRGGAPSDRRPGARHGPVRAGPAAPGGGGPRLTRPPPGAPPRHVRRSCRIMGVPRRPPRLRVTLEKPVTSRTTPDRRTRRAPLVGLPLSVATRSSSLLRHVLGQPRRPSAERTDRLGRRRHTGCQRRGRDVGVAVDRLRPTAPSPRSRRHALPELEALLPASVAGIDLERLSITGPDFYKTGSDVNRSQLDELLKNLGKTVDDLNVADAGDPTGRAVFEIGIFRVAGATPDQLLSEWVAFDQAAKPGRIKVTPETVDGRALTKVVDSSVQVGGTAYAFAIGDAIYLVKADDPKLLSAALAALPKP